MTIRLNGQTSGYVELEAPAAAGSNTLVLPTGNGSSGQYLQTNGSGTLSWQTVASLSNAEDGTGNNFEFNSGFGSNGVAYGVRAWINFDGRAATIGTGRANGNMDAVTDNGTGRYTVNFTNDMPDSNYTAFGNCAGTVNADGDESKITFNSSSYAVGSLAVRVVDPVVDPVVVNICIIR